MATPAVLLQSCLNGVRQPGEHPALPVTPEDLAAASAEALAAGADGLHVHPRDAGGRESLAAEHVGAALTAIRAALPRPAEISVTTGAWAVPPGADRAELVAAWRVLPDSVSVNWHEEGAEALAAGLLERGVGIEAGIWTVQAAVGFLGWDRRREVRRVLVEALPDDPEAAVAEAAAIVALLLRAGVRVPLLVHGEGGGAWPVLRWAAARGHRLRIGLEDSLTLPDGSPAPSSAAQVRAAAAIRG